MLIEIPAIVAGFKEGFADEKNKVLQSKLKRVISSRGARENPLVAGRNNFETV